MNDAAIFHPLSRELRRKKLREIMKQTPEGSVRIPGKGKCLSYKIPLEYLTYNPQNTRFIAESKTYEKHIGRPLDEEDADDVAVIEKFIWNQKSDKNGSTIRSLIDDGQLQPGVVTQDGIILSGNRRFRLLNEIVRHPDWYKAGRDSARYFEAAIVDGELDSKAIFRYESFYQYGTDDKIDYDPIQKYIGAYEQKQVGFTNEEIAQNFLSLTDGKANVVAKWLQVYDLMVEYLDYIGEHEIYTALESQEESFLRLHQDLKSLNGGQSQAKGWGYDENDLDDYKAVFFDYIRLKINTHDTRKFKSLFLNEDEWKRFSSHVFEVTDSANIDSFEHYRANALDGEDESEISTKRGNDYEQKVENKLTEARKNAEARISDRDDALKPQKITNQVISKLNTLESIFAENPEYMNDDDLREDIRQIAKKSGHLKQEVD